MWKYFEHLPLDEVKERIYIITSILLCVVISLCVYFYTEKVGVSIGIGFSVLSLFFFAKSLSILSKN